MYEALWSRESNVNRTQVDELDFRHLQPTQIADTLDLLCKRIHERFPNSGLYRVASELHRVSQEAAARADRIRRPLLWLRAIAVCLVLVIVGVCVQIAKYVRLNDEVMQLEHFVQSVEAAIGSIVFIGAAIVYLFSLEQRLRRNRALEALRELRSLAHIIDMHQLTKDPERTVGRGPSTASSPRRTMTPFELGRYLDYCSELLSLVSKTGAVYVQNFPDSDAIEANDRLTNLTTDLSRNIWQKIMILESAVAGPAAPVDATPQPTADASLPKAPTATAVPSTAAAPKPEQT
jgi:hypothetical protein